MTEKIRKPGGHSDSCWRFHPECAYKLIKSLKKENKELGKMVEEEMPPMLVALEMVAIMLGDQRKKNLDPDEPIVQALADYWGYDFKVIMERGAEERRKLR